MAGFTFEDLGSPEFSKLSEGDQFQIRRQVFRDLKKTDPLFNSIPFAEQVKVLFPDPVSTGVARERLTIGGEFRGGVEEFKGATKERGFLGTPVANLALPTLRMAASPLAPLFNLATAAGEKVSEFVRPLDVIKSSPPLLEQFSGPVPQQTPLPIQPSDILGGFTTAGADVGLPGLVGKGARIAGTGLRKVLPVRSEKVAGLASGLSEDAVVAQQRAVQQAKDIGLREAQQGGAFAVEEQAALAARQSAGSIAQREAVETGQRVSLEQARQRSLLGERGPRTIQEGIAPGAPTAREAGTRFQQEIFPKRRAEVAASFNKRYTALEKEAQIIPAETANFEVALNQIIEEPGILKGVLPTKAESIANRALRGIEEAREEITPISGFGGSKLVELQDDVYRRIRDKLSGGAPGQAETVSIEAFREAVAPVREMVTGKDMVGGVLRLRTAKRAAGDAGNRNMERQFRVLENALLEDVQIASPAIKAKLGVISNDYRRDFVGLFSAKAFPQKLVERVREDAQEIVGAIIQPAKSPRRVEAITTSFKVIKDPADRQLLTGAWFRGGIDEAAKTGEFQPKDFIKWWESYLDPKTDNLVLRTALGEKFKPTNDFVRELRRATQGKFDEVADEGISNILKTRAAQSKGEEGILRAAQKVISGKRVQVSKESEGLIGEVIKTRDASLKQLRDEFDKAVTALGGSTEIPARAGWWMGPLMVLSGVGRVVTGAVGPGMIGIGGGVIEVMGHATMIKMLNTLKGGQLMRRFARSVPGSVEALALARELENIARNLPEEGGGEGVNPLVGPPLLP